MDEKGIGRKPANVERSVTSRTVLPLREGAHMVDRKGICLSLCWIRLAGGGWMAMTWLIAMAQPTPPVPPQVSPGVLQQQLRRLVPEPSITDRAPTPIPAPAFTYPPGAEAIRLTVRKVELSGNTAIPRRTRAHVGRNARP